MSNNKKVYAIFEFLNLNANVEYFYLLSHKKKKKNIFDMRSRTTFFIRAPITNIYFMLPPVLQDFDTLTQIHVIFLILAYRSNPTSLDVFSGLSSGLAGFLQFMSALLLPVVIYISCCFCYFSSVIGA